MATTTTMTMTMIMTIIKIEEKHLLDFLPIGKGKIIGIWEPTIEHPNGIIYIGNF